MSNSKAVVAVLLAALLLSSAGCSFYDKLQSRGELNKGVGSFKEQKYTDSIKYFKNAIAMDPSFPEPYSYLATAYAAMYVPGSQEPSNIKYAEDAIRGFETVLQKNPGNANAMVYIAQLYYQLKQYDKSKEWCRKIISKDPKNYEAHYRIGVIDYDISIDATGLTGEKVSEITGSKKTEVTGAIQEGIKALEESIRIKASYFEAMHYLNLLYREQAKFVTSDSEKNQILLKADTVALKAMELEKAAKAAQDTRVLNLKKE
jgi:tetratricopeptide (TPR) repeat protein